MQGRKNRGETMFVWEKVLQKENKEYVWRVT